MFVHSSFSTDLHLCLSAQNADRGYPSDSTAYIEKHVDFTDEFPEDENGRSSNQEHQLKLHRRDTPHHLKNKRIISKQTDSVTLDVSR